MATLCDAHTFVSERSHYEVAWCLVCRMREVYNMLVNFALSTFSKIKLALAWSVLRNVKLHHGEVTNNLSNKLTIIFK